MCQCQHCWALESKLHLLICFVSLVQIWVWLYFLPPVGLNHSTLHLSTTMSTSTICLLQQQVTRMRRHKFHCNRHSLKYLSLCGFAIIISHTHNDICQPQMHCKICFKIGITSLKTAAMRNAINYNIYSMSDKEYANESELERHHPHCEAWWWQHHAVGMRLYIRPWRAREVDGWNKCTKTQGNPGEKTWRSLQNTCDLEEDLLSSKTTTQSIKPVLHMLKMA